MYFLAQMRHSPKANELAWRGAEMRGVYFRVNLRSRIPVWRGGHNGANPLDSEVHQERYGATAFAFVRRPMGYYRSKLSELNKRLG